MRSWIALAFGLMLAVDSAAKPTVTGAPVDLSQAGRTEIFMPEERAKQLDEGQFNAAYIEGFDDRKLDTMTLELHRRGLLAIAVLDFPSASVETDSFHPSEQKFVIDQASKLAREHDLDGIQLRFNDESLTQAGVDSSILEQFKMESSLEGTLEQNRSKFEIWRRDQISEFAMEFVTQLRQVNPDLLLSVEVCVDGANAALTDWIAWTKWCECGGKHWDEITIAFSKPQTVKDGESFLQPYLKQLAAAERMFITVVLPAIDDPIIALEQIEASGVQGSVSPSDCFVIAGSDDRLLRPDSAKPRTRHPAKPANWREPSIPATREGDVFVADLKEGNRYHVIVKKDGVWNDIGSFDLKPGRNTFLQDGDALELMVDRRP